MRKSRFVVLLMLTFAMSVLNPMEAHAERKTKDTMVFAQGSDLTSLDPHIGKQLRAFAVTCNMFEQLVKFDDKMENILPSLAESWERISDTEMRFALRKNVRWHNGDPFTADDVKFSYERMLAMPSVVNNIAFLESVTVEDPQHVVLKTKYSYAPLLAALTNPPCAIVPKNVVEKDEKAFALNPVGTGPYKFVEWKSDDYCKLEAFEGYYGEKAKTKYLVMKVVPESAQRCIMLETGELDVAYDIPPMDVKRIESTAGLKILRVVSNKTISLNMNTRSKGPLHDKLVRQAVAYAIDKEEILSGVLNNIGMAANLPLPPAAFGYDPAFPAPGHDLAKAKALLKEAGYEKGFDCSIWVDDDQVSTEIATVLQAQLLEAGINLKVEVMKQQTKLDRLYKKQDSDFNTAYFNCNIGDGDYNLYSCFHPASGSNHCNFDDPGFTALMEKSRAQYDDAERKKIYHQLYGILLDQMPCVPLYYEDICVGLSTNVENMVLSKIGANKYQPVVVYEK